MPEQSVTPTMTVSIEYATDRDLGRYLRRLDILEYGAVVGSVTVRPAVSVRPEAELIALAHLWAHAVDMHAALKVLVNALRVDSSYVPTRAYFHAEAFLKRLDDEAPS